MGRKKYAHSRNITKKERYQSIELARLKKCLGIMDVDQPTEIATTQNTKDLTKDEKLSIEEDQELKCLLKENQTKGGKVELKNDKTGKIHVYDTKTLKDQHGNYPPWFKRTKTLKRLRKKAHAQKKNFKQQWTTAVVPI